MSVLFITNDKTLGRAYPGSIAPRGPYPPHPRLIFASCTSHKQRSNRWQGIDESQ
jgi:hypothetical protein